MDSGDGYVLVYAIDDDSSFEEMDALFEEIESAGRGHSSPKILVGAYDCAFWETQLRQMRSAYVVMNW